MLYKTKGICAQEIEFELTEDKKVHNVKFIGGCSGNTQGVAVMSLKKKAAFEKAVLFEESGIVNASRYRCRTIPTTGALVKEEDALEKQTSFDV